MNASPSSNLDFPLAGQRLVIVEDEYIQYLALVEELSDAGAQIVGFAGSVHAALKMVKATLSDGGISMAVLDINLCGERVLPVADMLAANGVPFVFLTGYGDQVDTGPHTGAPVIEKPYNCSELLVRIVTALDLEASPCLLRADSRNSF
jgi:DNA-binding response OmpR family regulator